jgi:large subunit ribosomal protein L18
MANENKRVTRLRRAAKTRARMVAVRAVRLSVHRSNDHIYARVIDPGNRIVACASTLEKELKQKLKKTGNVEAAAWVGQRIAEKARKLGIKRVAFDRSGYAYHGRVKALADAARSHGLEF